MSDLSESEQQLRWLVNESRRTSAPWRSESRFNQLCSALDVIGDTELGIDEYLDKEWKIETPGQLYVALYGIMQILIVQQDAVLHAAEALGVEIALSDKLLVIRNIRNNSIGHPTKRGRKGDFSFCFISRGSMKRFRFDLLIAKSNGNQSYGSHNVSDMINAQRVELTTIMHTLIENEESAEFEYKDQFKNGELQETLPGYLEYMIEKLYSKQFGDAPESLYFANIKALTEAESALRSGLEVRGVLEDGDFFEDLSSSFLMSLKRLKQYYNDGPSESFESADALIHLKNLSNVLKEFRQLALELDEAYDTSRKET